MVRRKSSASPAILSKAVRPYAPIFPTQTRTLKLTNAPAGPQALRTVELESKVSLGSWVNRQIKRNAVEAIIRKARISWRESFCMDLLKPHYRNANGTKFRPAFIGNDREKLELGRWQPRSRARRLSVFYRVEQPSGYLSLRYGPEIDAGAVGSQQEVAALGCPNSGGRVRDDPVQALGLELL
jgi:hypothetical protein